MKQCHLPELSAFVVSRERKVVSCVPCSARLLSPQQELLTVQLVGVCAW